MKILFIRNPSKSNGTDDIPAGFVKDAASVLTKSSVHINLSIEQNVVPNDLKNAVELSLCLRK